MTKYRERGEWRGHLVSAVFPEMGAMIMIVSGHYQVKGEDLVHSRQGYGNEARSVAMYLSRRLRGDRLKEIGDEFGLGNIIS